jgi:hypothetical protein
MDFKKLYSEYQKLDPKNLFSEQSFFNRFSRLDRYSMLDIHNIIDEAIVCEDKSLLRFALNIAYREGVDKNYSTLIAKLLPATWHDEHEDLINTIYLKNINDDIFTDSLYKIVTEPHRYRKYDDEMESTLRKCVHALKMINSENANTHLEKLKETKNSNIDVVLSMYS